jgi:hypothetical protein
MEENNKPLRKGQSLASDPRQAVRELHQAIAQPDMALIIFFCSSHYDLDLFAAAINESFAGTTVIGCTTAGEMGPAGYGEGGVVGLSFSAGNCSALVGRIDHLATVEESAVRDQVWEMRGQPTEGVVGLRFAVMLIDGLCGREETIAHGCQAGLGNVPLVGGSAGDDQRLLSTKVFSEGAFRENAAVLAIVTTDLPFKVFRSHHFVGASDPLVVTAADAARRIVREINGRPAAEEYARVAGIDPGQLNAAHFAASPMVVKINGNDHVRSIRQVNEDGSLTLYCAIDSGVVLRLARNLDLIKSRKALFADLRQKVGGLDVVLGFNCIHCSIEAQGGDQNGAIEQLFKDNGVVGFSCYGEQFMGVHVNQTFTGVAIGDLDAR